MSLKEIYPKDLFGDLFGKSYINILYFIPEIQEFLILLNYRCDNNFTITYEPGYLYTGFKPYNNKNKIVKKSFNNRKFKNSLFSGCMFKKGSKQTDKLLDLMMILCLNKKHKTKGQKERECISSIQTSFYYADNNLFILISSLTSSAYEGRKYNKLLRFFIVLIYYYLYTNELLIYNSQIINYVYIESEALDPISLYLLLQIGFGIVIEDKIDDVLTQTQKSSSFESLKQFLDDNCLSVKLRYSIHSMTPDDITKIQKQITNLIIGTSPDNNKTIKCLNNKNNRKKTLWNNKKNNNLNASSDSTSV